MLLKDRRVWVTGASSGIGEALAVALASRGARVAITARRTELLEAVAARCAAGSAPPVIVVPADVTDRAAVVAAVATIEAALGGIDLAILNAGGRTDSLIDTMTLNYSSVVYGIEAVLPGMLARGSGHLAAVASLAGYRPTPMSAGYGASKAAVIHLLNALRFELEPRGIGVTVINPGFVKTPLTEHNLFPMPFLMEAGDAAERIVRGLERGKKEIHFPAPLSWTLKVMRILPYPLYEWIAKHTMMRRE